MTTDGLDLLTVVMHELAHLRGYDHNDDPGDLFAGPGGGDGASLPKQ